MTCQVLKWTVPVDDDQHPIGGGDVVHVHATASGAVQVWTLEDGTRPARFARIYGTGHPLPDDAIHQGTTVVGGFVWHLFTTT